MNERLKGRTPLAKGVGFLEEFSKDEIKGKVDIAALFASFGVQLEKKGSSWMGLCPFHEDKNPSLSVDSAKGLYHCFGCGEGGDVFELVMKYRNLNFKEALDFLKDFVSTAARTTAKDSPRRNLEMRAMESSPSLADVIAAYRKNLEASSEARDYLQSRGLMLPELLSRFSACYSSGDLIERLGLLSLIYPPPIE